LEIGGRESEVGKQHRRKHVAFLTLLPWVCLYLQRMREDEELANGEDNDMPPTKDITKYFQILLRI